MVYSGQKRVKKKAKASLGHGVPRRCRVRVSKHIGRKKLHVLLNERLGVETSPRIIEIGTAGIESLKLTTSEFVEGCRFSVRGIRSNEAALGTR